MRGRFKDKPMGRDVPGEGYLNSSDLSGLAELRSKIYGFLSSIYVKIPDHDSVKRLIGIDASSFLADFPLHIGLPREMEAGLKELEGFIRSLKGRPVEDVRRTLSVEGTRLFRGLKPGYGPPPPYESVYRDAGQAPMNKSVLDVLREYSYAGAGVPVDCNDPPDHVGVELDFMRFLTEREAESWEKERPDDALGFIDAERRFLRKHILKWVPEFCDKVIAMAEFDFYRGIARMTKGFVSDDYERIRDL